MALIECPECTREISDKAPSCPGCGYVSQAGSASLPAVAKTASTGDQIAGAGLGVILLMAIGAYFVSNSPGLLRSMTGSGSGGATSVINQVMDKTFSIEVGGTPGTRFQGNYGCVQTDGKNSQQTIEGSVPASYSCQGSIVSVVFQKQSQGSEELNVDIKAGGVSVKSASTTAVFGLIQAASN